MIVDRFIDVSDKREESSASADGGRVEATRDGYPGEVQVRTGRMEGNDDFLRRPAQMPLMAAGRTEESRWITDGIVSPRAQDNATRRMTDAKTPKAIPVRVDKKAGGSFAGNPVCFQFSSTGTCQRNPLPPPHCHQGQGQGIPDGVQ